MTNMPQSSKQMSDVRRWLTNYLAVLDRVAIDAITRKADTARLEAKHIREWLNGRDSLDHSGAPGPSAK